MKIVAILKSSNKFIFIYDFNLKAVKSIESVPNDGSLFTIQVRTWV